jgi:hypothetical protein
MSKRSESEVNAVFRRMKDSKLGLTFASNDREKLLSDIDDLAEERKRRKPISKSAAVPECDRVVKISRKLRELSASEVAGGVDWVGETHSRIGATSTKLGAAVRGLSRDEWARELTYLLDQITTAASDGAEAARQLPSKRGPKPASEEDFAKELHRHFIRAGGQSPSKPGSPGFQAFLKLVWRLLPPDYRRGDGNETRFAERFAKLVK